MNFLKNLPMVLLLFVDSSEGSEPSSEKGPISSDNRLLELVLSLRELRRESPSAEIARALQKHMSSGGCVL